MASTQDTYYHYASAHGTLTIGASSRGITCVEFGQTALPGALKPTALTNNAATQLQEYLAGKRKTFDVPLDPQGSAFQKEVWVELSYIPYGETRTAAQIADVLGKPGSHRAIGTAIRQNKLAPFVPSHRALPKTATGNRAKIFRALQALEQRERIS